MTWPERPTCHEKDPRYLDLPIDWEQRGPFRHCSYCGSLHPEDLIQLFHTGATLTGSDWKYGYPHKFYLKNAEPRPDGAGKWYSQHLEDVGYDDESLTYLIDSIWAHSGVRFTFDDDGRLRYSAPHFDFQKV